MSTNLCNIFCNVRWARRQLSVMMLACASILLCACSQSALEQRIREIAADPALQNMQSYTELIEIIRNNPDDYAAYITESGDINVDLLQTAINNIGKEEDDTFSWDTQGYVEKLTRPLSLRLMLERSGSMNGYDARQGKGDFKRAINEVINRFPDQSAGADGNILIVNSDIQPYAGSFQNFVQDRNIFYTTRNVGNASYTDFGKIFKYALSDTVPGRITVLVTDMIYSPEGTQGVGSDKLRNEESALMSMLGKDYKDRSMLIVRLNSDFIGAYYPFDSPKGGKTYSGKRPYYLIFMGTAADMDRMLSGSEYASLRDFASLPGFEAYYYLGRGSVPPGYYCLLPRTKDDTGLYSVAPGDGKDATSKRLIDIEADPRTGKYTFSMAVDLSAIPADDNYVKDISNWATSTPESLKLLAVDKITDEMRNVRNSRFLEKATHIIRLEGDRRLNGNVDIRLQNRIPTWVAEGSSTDDRNPYATTFATTTFGLNEMIQGLYSGAYGTVKAPDYTVYKIKIN